MIRFTSDTITVNAAAGEPTGERRIDAIAVPWNTFATVSDGTEVMFKEGSLPVDGKAPRVFMYHDSSQPVGIVSERLSTSDGMLASMKISRTALGDDALVLAADGVMDVSVGVNPTEFSYDDQGRMIVTAADWMELSLVPIPAFAGATITQVAASAETEPDTEEPTEPVEETTVEATPAAEAVEAAAIPTAPIPAQAKRTFAMPSAAEYLAAMNIGGDTFRRVNEAFVEASRNKQTALQAAAGVDGNTNTENTPGLLNQMVLGPVFEDLNYIRPVVAAVGARAMPDGGTQKTFIRPTWTTHVSAAVQGAELGAISQTSPQIASNVVSKQTVSGGVTFSVQDVDFTSPASMEIILRDLVGQFMLKTDDIAADAITAGATASGATWDVTPNDPTTLISAIYGAAVNILSATNFLPDTIFVSTNVWELLGRQLDANKQLVFPYVGAAGLMGMNAAGTGNVTQMNTFNPLGLNLVVDRNFAADTMVVARASAIEYYEQVKGIMTREVPLNLGKEFSYYGYSATFIADSTQVQSIALV
jgi:phage head maturation protease